MKRTGFLLSLGLLPVVAGCLLNLTIRYFLFLPFWIMNLGFLALWGFLHYKVLRQGESLVTCLLCTHVVPLLCLALVLWQELVNGSFWLNWIGYSTQSCFLPVLTLGMRTIDIFTRGMPAVWTGALGSFLLMLLAALAACLVRGWVEKNNTRPIVYEQ